MSLIVHLLMENSVYANRAAFSLFIKDYVIPDLVSQKAGLDDVICFFEEDRNTVQTLDSGINLPIIDNRLILRPGFNCVIPNAVQIDNGLSG